MTVALIGLGVYLLAFAAGCVRAARRATVLTRDEAERNLYPRTRR